MKKLLKVFFLSFVSTHSLSAMESQTQKPWRSITKEKILFAEKIFWAIERDDATSLEQLLSSNPLLHIVLSEATKYGLTPLQRALDKKKVDYKIIKCLLESGANPNQPLLRHIGNEYHPVNFYPGWTACHIAARKNVPQEILQLLEQHDGDFLIEDQEGWSALGVAHKKRIRSVIEYFSVKIESENQESSSGEKTADEPLPIESKNSSLSLPYEPIVSLTQFILVLCALYWGINCI